MVYWRDHVRSVILIKQEARVLALDIGGTQFRVALANERGDILKRFAAPVASADDPQTSINQIVEAITDIIAGTDRSTVKGLGVAIAGLVTPDTGVLLTSPNLLGWYGTPIKDIFERELAFSVWVANDANLAALGERRFGAGRGADDLIYITVSTGVGGGIISGGRMLVGAKGFAAEVGHMTIDYEGPLCNCGNTGCLEMLASGTAIARLAGERISRGEWSMITDLVSGDLSRVTAEVVESAARRGDAVAADIFHTAAVNLGIGVVNLMHLFNPEIIIIGGGVSKAGGMLFEPVRQVVAERAMRDIEVSIVPAALNDDPGLLGAVALVLENT